MSFHSGPCTMTNTDQFFVKICGCGVVHLNFGCTVVNVSYEATIAISETLKELSGEIRGRLQAQKLLVENQIDPDNVIPGNFPRVQN